MKEAVSKQKLSQLPFFVYIGSAEKLSQHFDIKSDDNRLFAL